jgi:hypothetical protein
VLEGLLGHRTHVASSAARLICLSGPDAGREFPLATGHSEIGRSPEAHVQLKDPAVSRVHARLRSDTGVHVLETVSERNGLFVNGEMIDGSVELRAGDEVELGRSKLRFEAVAETSKPEELEPPAPVPVGRDPQVIVERVVFAVGTALAFAGLLFALGLGL